MATSFREFLTAIVCITIRLMSARTTELINLLKVRGNFHISLKHPLQRYTHISIFVCFPYRNKSIWFSCRVQNLQAYHQSHGEFSKYWKQTLRGGGGRGEGRERGDNIDFFFFNEYYKPWSECYSYRIKMTHSLSPWKGLTHYTLAQV